MRRITISLTENEYAELEQRALQDRRTTRDMAARLVTQGPDIRIIPTVPWQPITPVPWQHPIITSTSTLIPECYACKNPDSTIGHTCALSPWHATGSLTVGEQN